MSGVDAFCWHHGGMLFSAEADHSEFIFDPLGLKDTSFNPISREGRDARLHVRDGLAGPCTPSDIAGG